MAVIHFKSGSSLVKWVIIWTIIGIIYCIANGAGFLNILLWVFFNFFVVIIGLALGRPSRPNYQKEAYARTKSPDNVASNNGFDNIRHTLTENISRVSCKMDGKSITDSKIIAIIEENSKVLCDYYFRFVKDATGYASTSNGFSSLDSVIAEHEALQDKILINFFGVSLGLLLFKSSQCIDGRVNRQKVKAFIGDIGLDDDAQKALYDRVKDTLYVLEEDKWQYPTNYLGGMAMSFFGAELEKGNIADPMYSMGAKVALVAGHDALNTDEQTVTMIRKAKLISKKTTKKEPTRRERHD